MKTLIAFGTAKDNLFDLRREELRQTVLAQASLQTSSSLVLNLGEKVAELVKTAQHNSDTAAARTAQAIENGQWLLLLITALSVAGAAVIAVQCLTREIMRRILYGAIVAIIVGPASAHVLDLGDIQINHPWTHASPAGASASPVYMTITTVSDTPDRLLGASSPVADHAEIHNHIQSENTMGMEVLPSLELAKGKPIEFSPHGLRMVLIGLRAPLEEYDSFPITLQFERAGPKTIEVTVEEPGAAEPEEDYGL